MDDIIKKMFSWIDRNEEIAIEQEDIAKEQRVQRYQDLRKLVAIESGVVGDPGRCIFEPKDEICLISELGIAIDDGDVIDTSSICGCWKRCIEDDVHDVIEARVGRKKLNAAQLVAFRAWLIEKDKGTLGLLIVRRINRWLSQPKGYIGEIVLSGQ